jgi:hypothetical protein
MTKSIYARLFALHGHWGELDLILQGDPIPKDLEENGKRLRRAFLAEQWKRDLQDNLNPPKRKEVRFRNAKGEEIVIDGYEVV